jgi:hypothetical protein
MSDEKVFTVTDRRPFSSDGEPRSAGATQTAENPERQPAGDPPPDAFEHEPPVDLSGFVLSLALQASHALAGRAPDGKPAEPDLRGARRIIGVLEMLQEKTAGRRTPEEDAVLDHLLYDLRMGYLARSGVVKA